MKCIFVAAVAVLALSLAAQAGIVTRTEFVSFQSFVPCANNNAGEIVDISGYFVTRLYLHVVGTTFSGYFQFRPQNMTGTGESTGTIYHAVGDTMETFTGFIPNSGGDGTYRYIQNFQLVSPGGSFLVHTNEHFTISGSGNFLDIHN